ncbi:MAG: type IVB secretion system protein IcmH/DotU [Gammaproteobacteria bacterium]|nr:type IVB secretion system protein IcmH/DotU [Gammaproteobacteria bacterium]
MADDDDIFSQLGDSDRTILRPTPQPSAGGNKTIIKPTPGGAQQTANPYSTQPAQAIPQAAPHSIPQAPIANLVNVLDQTETNRIISVTRPLLSLLTRLSQSHQHNDVNGLHARTIQEVRNFEANAQQKGIDPQQILIARYILCAAIDETVLNTPWGANSLWPSKSLLSTFHRENTGGQKFFTLMERMQQNPGVNIELLELISLCLALGFLGKYRVVQGGLSHVETIRSQLHQQIAMVRGEYERDLSPHSEGVHIKRAADRNVPLWVIGAITGAVVLAAYISFSVALNNDAQPVLEKIQSIFPIEAEQSEQS